MLENESLLPNTKVFTSLVKDTGPCMFSKYTEFYNFIACSYEYELLSLTKR